MKPAEAKALRCAIYTRVSTDQGLEQEFNSLDNQRESAEAYVKSQAHEGWRCLPALYDDGGFSGGSLERPALQRLLADIRARRVDVVVVYKVDRLTRSSRRTSELPTTGSSDPTAAAPPSVINRRQRYSRLGATPRRRATDDTVSPGSKLSSMICSFCSVVQCRRRTAPVISSIRR